MAQRLLTLLVTLLLTFPAQAQKFQLHRGINISHWLSQSSDRGDIRAKKFTREDVKFIAEQGFDHIRIPIDEEQMFLEDGTKDEEAFRLLHKALELCGKYNLRAIVDLHILRSHHFNAAYKPLFTEKAAQEAFFECDRGHRDAHLQG